METNLKDLRILNYKNFESPYEKVKTSNWSLKNKGYDYEKNLFQISVSKYLLVNKNLTNFYPYLNKLFSYLINKVKYLRNYNNFLVDKNYQFIN